MAKQITKKELKSLQDDMLAMQQQLKEQSINNKSIAKFIINHMFINNLSYINQSSSQSINNKSIAKFIINHMFINNLSCINQSSSACVSCPYRYDCKYCNNDISSISMRVLVL